MAVSIPHFALPFRFENGRAVVVEQDTEDEVAQCVEVLVSTPTGSRQDQLDYGIADPTFTDGIDGEAILGALEDWEPRAVADVSSDPDTLDELVQRVTVTLGIEGNE